MIKKITVRNFKKYEYAEFPIPKSGSLLAVGPNNSGKTTMMQAIGVWALALRKWGDLLDLAIDEQGNYRQELLNKEDLHSVPLFNITNLWHNDKKSIDKPITIKIKSTLWNIGIEIFSYAGGVYIRPLKSTKATDLKAFFKAPLSPVYVAPIGALNKNDFFHGAMNDIDRALSENRAGDVLRSLLMFVKEDESAWQTLNDEIENLFKIELQKPSEVSGMSYRHTHQNDLPYMPLESAGHGFLQTLLLFSVALSRKNSIILADAPDAHQHFNLRSRVYERLCTIAENRNIQLIITTHSDALLTKANKNNIVSFFYE